MKNYKKFSRKGLWGVKHNITNDIIIDANYRENDITIRNNFLFVEDKIFFEVNGVAVPYPEYIEMKTIYNDPFFLLRNKNGFFEFVKLEQTGLRVILKTSLKDINDIGPYLMKGQCSLIINDLLYIYDLEEEKYTVEKLKLNISNRLVSIRIRTLAEYVSKEKRKTSPLRHVYLTHYQKNTPFGVIYEGKFIELKGYEKVETLEELFCDDKRLILKLIHENGQQSLFDFKNNKEIMPLGNHEFHTFFENSKFILDIKQGKCYDENLQIIYEFKKHNLYKPFILLSTEEGDLIFNEKMEVVYKGLQIENMYVLNRNERTGVYFTDKFKKRSFFLNEKGQPIITEELMSFKCFNTYYYIVFKDMNNQPYIYETETFKKVDFWDLNDDTFSGFVNDCLISFIFTKEQILKLFKMLNINITTKTIVNLFYDNVYKEQLLTDEELNEIKKLHPEYTQKRGRKNWGNIIKKLTPKKLKEVINTLKTSDIIESELFSVWKD